MNETQETTDQLREDLDFIEQLQRAWKMFGISPNVPTVSQFLTWINLHTPERILRAQIRTSEKADKMEDDNKEFTDDHATKFLSSVANNMKSIEENEDANGHNENPT